MTAPNPIPFANTYIDLPPRFYSRQHPASAPAPQWIRNNPALATRLGVDPEWLASDAALQAFAGNTMPPGAEPIATVYAAHQFGGWNPQLGDGRAILLGEVIDSAGQRHDIQLKGAGQTPYSRSGDGLSPLGPVLREYIVSEAMAALGIPTTRSLAAVTTGARVFRDQVLPGAVLTRVAKSHIRVGHFQYFSARNDIEAVKLLADHLLARDFPEALQAANPYQALLGQAIRRQASLIAQWQAVGFIHGVMNTDNMLVCGETIDYGPCAFMDEYDPAACFSSIDHGGRYAYRNQPAIARWNLTWLAQSLLPLLSAGESDAVAIARNELEQFVGLHHRAWSALLLQKFGLCADGQSDTGFPDSDMDENSAETRQFAADFLAAMAREQLDFTLTFRHLADLSNTASPAQPAVSYSLPASFDPLLQQWRQWQARDPRGPALIQRAMHAVNPAYIPRNHQIEAAIQAATRAGDLQPFQRLVDVLAEPFTFNPAHDDLTRPPQPDQRVLKTFCGT